MKVANLITSIITSLVLGIGVILPLSLGGVASFIYLIASSSPRFDDSAANEPVLMLICSILAGIFLLLIIIFALIAFLRSKKISRKRYTVFSSISIISATITGILVIAMTNLMIGFLGQNEFGFNYTFAVAGFITIMVSVVLTIVNAIKKDKKAA